MLAIPLACNPIRFTMANNFNWTCPYCQRAQVVVEDAQYLGDFKIYLKDLDVGPVGYHVLGVACANKDCRKLSLNMGLFKRVRENQTTGNWEAGEQLGFWRLLPESSAKPQPSYIPGPITEDYYEACRIRDLSPKASATLARRCLQGMIRDFCGIAKGRLVDEITQLRRVVDEGMAPPGVLADTVDAIDHVRTIGNIGAHMEKDINVIVDVDPGEAQHLLDLVEMLFDEWYVARESRTKKLRALGLIAAEKNAAQGAGKLASPAKQLPAPSGEKSGS